MEVFTGRAPKLWLRMGAGNDAMTPWSVRGFVSVGISSVQSITARGHWTDPLRPWQQSALPNAKAAWRLLLCVDNWRWGFRLDFCAVVLLVSAQPLSHSAFSLDGPWQVWRNSWSHLHVSLGGDKDEASIFQTGLQDCLLPPGAAGDHQWGRNGQANVCIPWALQCSQVSAAPPLLHHSLTLIWVSLH